MDTTPYWKEAPQPATYAPLDEDLHVDVLIIGGGITGVSTAQLLSKSGLRIALVERDHLGSGDTIHTTAHLTYMTDTRLSELIRVCGREDAKIAWEAGRAAIDHIRRNAEELGVDVGFQEVDGYLSAARDADSEEQARNLKNEAGMAAAMGFDVEYLDRVPPLDQPGIRFARQAEFHPAKYLQAVAADAAANGVAIFEHSNVTAFETGPRQVTANGHRIAFEWVVIATHVPLQGNSGTFGAALFQTKLAPYSTYALAAEIPKGTLAPMIWSDTAEPFNYFRVNPGDASDLVIFGGEDHKTGQETATEERFEALRQRLFDSVGRGVITHRWSGQVIETVDGLPFIGETSDGQFIATGFSGNGMTFGTVAALMARDKITGKENPWAKAFHPGRKKFGAAASYLSENIDFPYCLVKDRLGIKAKPGELAAGDGEVVKAEGEIIARCRDADGTLHERSAICPHMGCVVAWNHGEQSWDCPCHGSRFQADGSLIAGPAEEGLSVLEPSAGGREV